MLCSLGLCYRPLCNGCLSTFVFNPLRVAEHSHGLSGDIPRGPLCKHKDYCKNFHTQTCSRCHQIHLDEGCPIGKRSRNRNANSGGKQGEGPRRESLVNSIEKLYSSCPCHPIGRSLEPSHSDPRPERKNLGSCGIAEEGGWNIMEPIRELHFFFFK